MNLSEAVLSAQNSWTHVWDGLDPDQEYTVAEAAIQGYTAKASIEESQSANATGGVDYVKIFRITNTKETKPTPTPAPTPSPTPAPTPEVTPVPRVDQLPQTGDSSNLSGLLMLMAFSAALSALFAVRRRKA